MFTESSPSSLTLQKRDNRYTTNLSHGLISFQPVPYNVDDVHHNTAAASRQCPFSLEKSLAPALSVMNFYGKPGMSGLTPVRKPTISVLPRKARVANDQPAKACRQ
jgi:hypothetical protein